MRPINEATLAILKSQNLTGQNRFGHSLRLEGVDYYGPVKDVKTNSINQGNTVGDFAIRSDGKVLFVYLSGLNICCVP